jgi:hypothetical protein
VSQETCGQSAGFTQWLARAPGSFRWFLDMK